MPGGGSDWVDVLLFIVARAAGPIIVLGGGFPSVAPLV